MNIDVFHQYLSVSAQKKALEQNLDIVTQECRRLETQVILEFEQAGVSSLRLNDHTVYLQRQVWASPKDGDHDRLATVLRLNGLDALIQQKINSHSISAYVREMETNEQALPQALVDALKISETYNARIRTS